MNTHNAVTLPAGHPLKQDYPTGCLGGVKRKLSVFLRPDSDQSYPSPPMSNPPSPPRHPSDTSLPLTAESHSRPPPSVVTTSAAARMPGFAIGLPPAHHGMIYSQFDPPSGFPHYAPLPPPPPFQPSLGLAGHLAFPPIRQGSALGAIALPGGTAPSARGEVLRGGGRKSKTHVASACVNCKRAHLSCDVGRPCTRCVATGKQDTCYDVQHKKRGRPRLREDGDFKVEQMIPKSGSSSTAATAVGNAPTRPIAATRSTRSDSFRSIRSHKSEGSFGGVTISPTYPAFSGSAQLSSAVYQPFPPGQALSQDPPVAFLDLDLVVIKANQSFRRIFGGEQDVVGRSISDLVDSAEGGSFDDLRRQLRDERELLDPTYMPPIMQPGQDPIESIPETDAEMYTQRVDEHVQNWILKRGSLPRPSFSARVRLAKKTVYFAVVTFPPSRTLWDLQSIRQPFQPHFVRTPVQQPHDVPYDPLFSSRQAARPLAPSGVFSQPPTAGPPYLPTPQPRSIGHPPTGYPAQQPPSVKRSPPLPQQRQQQQQQPQPIQQPMFPPNPGFAPILPSIFPQHPPFPGPPSSTTQLPGMDPRLSIVGSPRIPPSRRESFIRERPLSSSSGSVHLPPLMGATGGGTEVPGLSRRSSLMSSSGGGGGERAGISGLPPIVDPAPAAAERAHQPYPHPHLPQQHHHQQQQQQQQQQSRKSSDDRADEVAEAAREEEERSSPPSPRKRRRVGIDDMLQRE